MKKTTLKSIGAVLAGFIAVAVLSVATDAILEALGIFPSSTKMELYVTWMLFVALIYRSIFTMVGGYITAKLASNNKMKHVVALMILGGIGGFSGAIYGWNLTERWYPIVLAVTGPLFVWFGGKIFISKK